MQCHVAMFGDAVSHNAFEFRAERQHRTEDFTDGCEIVIRDPSAETKQCLIEDRHGIKDVDESFCRNGRLAVVELGHNPAHSLLAKRDEHSASGNRSEPGGHTVGKDHVQGNGEGYVAEVGH